MKNIFWLSLIIIISLAGYLGLTKLSTEFQIPSYKFQVSKSEFQDIKIAGQVLKVEIADTSPARQQGLSDRKTLDESQGMLFIFDKPDRHSFWMKNINFPLDIIWFDENQIIVDMILNVEPKGADPQKIYQPSSQAKYVLEVTAGFAEKYNIKNGDEFIFLLK